MLLFWPKKIVKKEYCGIESLSLSWDRIKVLYANML